MIFDTSGHNQTNPVRGFLDGYSFVLDYLNSPGYRRRLSNLPNAIKDFMQSSYDPSGAEDNYIYEVYRKNLEPTSYNFLSGVEFGLDEPNAFYDNDTNVVSFGDKSIFDIMPHDSWDYIATHELGHAIDNNFMIEKIIKDSNDPSNVNNIDWTDLRYSDLFTILRNSNSYKKQYENLRDAYEYEGDAYNGNTVDMLDEWSFHPNYAEEYNMEAHDGKPAESYADLIELRKRLYDAGVYDSRQSILPFNRTLLNVYKLLTPKEERGRTFDNFDDDDIIWMINNIAQNNTNSNKKFSLKGRYA